MRFTTQAAKLRVCVWLQARGVARTRYLAREFSSGVRLARPPWRLAARIDWVWPPVPSGGECMCAAAGTGCGKGRMIAACILDRWNRGYRRHLWMSAGKGGCGRGGQRRLRSPGPARVGDSRVLGVRKGSPGGGRSGLAHPRKGRWGQEPRRVATSCGRFPAGLSSGAPATLAIGMGGRGGGGATCEWPRRVATSSACGCRRHAGCLHLTPLCEVELDLIGVQVLQADGGVRQGAALRRDGPGRARAEQGRGHQLRRGLLRTALFGACVRTVGWPWVMWRCASPSASACS